MSAQSERAERWHPGPWAVDRDDRDGMEWNNHIVVASAPHLRICFVTHDGTKENVAGEAAAHLLAAAPELHAALAALLHTFHARPDILSLCGPHEHIQLMTAAAALNKATHGESTP